MEKLCQCSSEVTNCHPEVDHPVLLGGFGCGLIGQYQIAQKQMHVVFFSLILMHHHARAYLGLLLPVNGDPTITAYLEILHSCVESFVWRRTTCC